MTKWKFDFSALENIMKEHGIKSLSWEERRSKPKPKPKPCGQPISDVDIQEEAEKTNQH
jgi:hypothetical protein